jgi:anti-sigma factor RsiW
MAASLLLRDLTEQARSRSMWSRKASRVGGVGGWILGSRSPSGIDVLAREGTASYVVFAAGKRWPIEVPASERDDLRRWLSNRLNRPATAPDLSGASYQLLGGRLVANPQGQPAALFVHQNAAGTRLTLYVRPMSQGPATAIEQTDLGDVDGCAWIERGIGYSLVASESYETLIALARQVRQELAKPG